MSLNTAFFVASAPVPDDVGMAMNGTLRPSCFFVSLHSRYSTTESPDGSIAEIALPVSTALPPPMLTTQSGFSLR